MDYHMTKNEAISLIIIVIRGDFWSGLRKTNAMSKNSHFSKIHKKAENEQKVIKLKISLEGFT